MDTTIRTLSDSLHKLYLRLVESDPWEPGYGEIVAIHEHLTRVLREKGHKSMSEFSRYLEEAARDIRETWSTNRSVFGGWDKWLKPVFQSIQEIVPNGAALLTLL